jgi:hypothetical protein
MEVFDLKMLLPHHKLKPMFWLLGLFLLLAGYALPAKGQAPNSEADFIVPVWIEEIPLTQPAQACTGSFVTYPLDHTTTVPGGDEVRMFEANGAGLAINDLDNDGDLDIVLANHHDPNTVLWNEGGLRFETERMPYGDSRAANIVDVDGDGRLDVVLTRRTGAPNYWRNGGPDANPAGESRLARFFSQELLPGLAKPAYAINWADLDGDGDLDLVTGSYDAALLTDLGNSFLYGGGAGVFYYENQAGRFATQQLAAEAQAMALELIDLDGDSQLDILVGNDFAVPDQAWLRRGQEWQKVDPFAATSHSTMSFDHADIDNDGQFELFATDMKPIDDRPETMAAWQPLMDGMAHAHTPGDPQIMENVLQKRDGQAGFKNEAVERGLDASGWSWSAKFGDLDNDGFLDLYIVNGMIELRMFSHLPNHELVEPNLAFHNQGGGNFAPAPEWGLGSTLSGRGMSMADLDGDGDLDIVVNNLRGPAQLFENRLCGGLSLQVDLFWPGSGNSRAIGAEVVLYTSHGSFTRNIRASSGYLSGDPVRLHFGFPSHATLHSLEIRWPDGAVSTVEGIFSQTRLNVTR